jgi:hypothetical protein
MRVAKQKQDLTNQKITVHVPRQLLHEAQNISHVGITETVTNGLHLLVAAKAAENLRQMRGKVRFSIDVSTLREDR